MKTTNPAVSIQGVSKSFGGVHAVRDVSFDVADGERRVVIGTNGAGKTTLFNLITGDLRVTKGRILIYGRDVTRLPAFKRARLGMKRTYQTSALFDGITLRENVYLALVGGESPLNHLNFLKFSTHRKEHAARIEEILERVGLAERIDDMTSELSHGERRQLEIGLAMATNPRILLLDEPAAGLSLRERTQMLEILKSLDRSVTIILIEHDMNIALGVADIVTVMHEGAVIAEGTSDEIRANEQVQQIYLGGSVSA